MTTSFDITNPAEDAKGAAGRVYEAGMATVRVRVELRNTMDAIKAFKPQNASASLPELEAARGRLERELLESQAAHAAEVERAQLARSLLDFQTAQLLAARGGLLPRAMAAAKPPKHSPLTKGKR